MKLREYINKNFGGSQTNFAHYIKKPKQRITQMLKSGYIVVDGIVYSKRFILPKNKTEYK